MDELPLLAQTTPSAEARFLALTARGLSDIASPFV